MSLAIRNGRPLSRFDRWLVEHPIRGGVAIWIALALGSGVGWLVVGVRWTWTSGAIWSLGWILMSAMIIRAVRGRARRIQP